MMKEIHEQPKAVADTLNSVIREGRLDLTEIGLDDERIRSISQVYIVPAALLTMWEWLHSM